MRMEEFPIKQEKFEGPLGLLLNLLEKEKLSISDISLAKVADEYLSYIRKLEAIDPEELAEFLVVAASLMLIKSKSLLPELSLGQEEEESVEELRKRLELLKKMRWLAQELKKLAEAGEHIFTKEAYLGMEPLFYPPPGFSAELLRDAFTAFLASLPKIEKLAEEKIKKIISLEERITQIRDFLAGAVEKAFSDIVRGAKEKMEIIISFLAILELAKQKFIELHQRKTFADIIIKRPS